MKPNTVELGWYAVRELPKGEFIRLKDGGPVYQRGEYDRTSGKYELIDVNNVSRCVYRAGLTKVQAGFTY